MVPIIDTERLRLRPHRYDDLAPCAAMWADPAVTRYIGGRAATTQETWFKILRYAGLWPILGYGYWALEERSTGRFIGDIGFADFKRDITPSLEGFPEMGWALVSDAHGKGYATEAICAALAWGDEHLSSSRTVCIIGSENAASIRVAQKCGFREFARTKSFGDETAVFARERPTGAVH